MKRLFLYAALSVPVYLPAPSLASDVYSFHSSLIQGDVKAALQTVKLIAPSKLPTKDAEAFECIRTRFEAPPTPASGPGAVVLDIYRAYWHDVLLAKQSRVESEANLLKMLNGILPGTGWDRTSLDDTVNQTKLYLKNQGLYALLGVTSPNYELMLWTKEVSQTYQVTLPEKEVAVRIVFIDGFLSKGWLNYASCERLGAGGWTASGTLYALEGSYDRSSEEFRIGYLGHEGQHFVDNKDFPKLEQAELEYRAKLTEIILASDPKDRFNRFEKTARLGRSVPHLHAEYWLARQIRERIPAGSDADALRTAAHILLIESSTKARAIGASTVTRLLPD